MAWRSSGTTNEELIANLHRNNIITTERVKNAMLGVDRAHYAPSRPYSDTPQSIGHAATISAPHMHAHATEAVLLSLNPGARVLDVGSGSGYLTHVLANLVTPGGRVVGIEHIQPLVDLSTANMRKSEAGRQLLDSGTVKFIKGDGRKGWKEDAPYDVIHVGAAAESWHKELLDQLKAPGRLFIPVEDSYAQQYVWLVEKNDKGEVLKKQLFGVSYVPLTDAPN